MFRFTHFTLLFLIPRKLSLEHVHKHIGQWNQVIYTTEFIAIVSWNAGVHRRSLLLVNELTLRLYNFFLLLHFCYSKVKEVNFLFICYSADENIFRSDVWMDDLTIIINNYILNMLWIFSSNMINFSATMRTVLRENVEWDLSN